MKFGIVQLPGSTCDRDLFYGLTHVFNQDVCYLWHENEDLRGIDVVMIPGGFSYGDDLRGGAMARFSPIMKSIVDYAKAGGLVMGICNGFQILCEVGLLPGSLLKNRGLPFICKPTFVRVDSPDSPFTNQIRTGQILSMPIAHGEGRYCVEPEGLELLEKNDQILLRYCDERGRCLSEMNPNGSSQSIAGICSQERNVLGLMPHPERALEKVLGSEEGRLIFESVLETVVFEKGR